MEPPYTLTFEAFWAWLLGHPNCILRAGTPEAVLYDDEDFHWHFAAEGESTLLVQLLRGKRLHGELLLDPAQISYVQALPLEHEEEHVFELVTETETDRYAAFFFGMAHEYEGEEPFTPARVH